MWRYNGARESDEKNFVSHHALFFFHFFSSKKEKKSKQIFFLFLVSRVFDSFLVCRVFVSPFFFLSSAKGNNSFVPYDRIQHE